VTVLFSLLFRFLQHKQSPKIKQRMHRMQRRTVQSTIANHQSPPSSPGTGFCFSAVKTTFDSRSRLRAFSLSLPLPGSGLSGSDFGSSGVVGLGSGVGSGLGNCGAGFQIGSSSGCAGFGSGFGYGTDIGSAGFGFGFGSSKTGFLTGFGSGFGYSGYGTGLRFIFFFFLQIKLRLALQSPIHQVRCIPFVIMPQEFSLLHLVHFNAGDEHLFTKFLREGEQYDSSIHANSSFIS